MTSPASEPIIAKPRMRSSFGADDRLHEALFLVGRLGAQDVAHRQSSDAHRDALTLRLAFGQADARQAADR